MSNFQCAVCGGKKPMQTKKGLNYFKASNGSCICFNCIDQRDRHEMAEHGRIGLQLTTAGKETIAVNRSGNLKFRVTGTIADKNLAFRHMGYVWNGRIYPGGGNAVFQRSKTPVDVPAGANAKAGTAAKATATSSTRTVSKRKPPAKAGAKAFARK